MEQQHVERTLGIIKPDSLEHKNCGNIISIIEKSSLTIIGMKLLHLTSEQAAQFYSVHQKKPFFDELVSFMISGSIVVLALEGPDAIRQWRTLMGATDPKKAEDGTIRRLYGSSVTKNSCHGSDAPETAAVELSFFFKPGELVK